MKLKIQYIAIGVKMFPPSPLIFSTAHSKCAPLHIAPTASY